MRVPKRAISISRIIEFRSSACNVKSYATRVESEAKTVTKEAEGKQFPTHKDDNSERVTMTASGSATNKTNDAVVGKKTQLELDEELRMKLEGISGGGGIAGLEYENGKAVAMKRGVRDNMFRLI